MKRVVLALLASVLSGCAFVQNHPAPVVLGIVAALVIAEDESDNTNINAPTDGHVPTPTTNPCPTPAACQ